MRHDSSRYCRTISVLSMASKTLRAECRDHIYKNISRRLNGAWDSHVSKWVNYPVF
jgi:hypothetical protein